MILISPDKFKYSFTATEAAEMINKRLQALRPELKTRLLPAADGGEGSAEILARYLQAEAVKIRISDPLMRPIDAKYFYHSESRTALIESAEASGLIRLSKKEQNPLNTSSAGTGEMIAAAAEAGARTIITAIGGSATNDVGAGLVHALGVRFYDANNQRIIPTGSRLGKITSAETGFVKYDFNKIRLIFISDVSNPLCGPKGASRTFAPQKGASRAETEFLEQSVRRFRPIIENRYPGVSQMQGAGAAGGMAASPVAFFGARTAAGAEYILEKIHFEKYLKQSKLVITGEGKFDRESLKGKLPGTVIAKAQKYRKKVAVICGINSLAPEEIPQNTKVFSLFQGESPPRNFISETPERIEKAVMRLVKQLNF